MRERTSPGRRMNVSRSANSFAESAISAPSPRDLPTRGVEREVADGQYARALEVASAYEGAQAREELGEGERLYEVVVGAHVEAGDPVLDGVARSQHEHGRPDAPATETPASLEAVEPGKHDVEHDRVVVVRRGHPERIFAGSSEVCRESLLHEPASDQGCHPHFVLDDQDAHRFTITFPP